MARAPPDVRRDVVVVGASAGGVEALQAILRALPGDLAASLVVVQHRPPDAQPHLIDVLRRGARIPISWAEQGERHELGHAYLAPADLHVTFSDGHFNLTASPRENHARPSINRLFRSAAAHYGSRTLGVLLTGRLDDGVAGLVAISRVGGETIVQDPETALAPELPRNGLAAVPTSRVVPLTRIAHAIVEATTTGAPVLAVPEQVAERAAGVLAECGGPQAEVALWSAVRALDERGVMLESLAVDAGARGDAPAARQFAQSARTAYDQARLAGDCVTRLTTSRG